MRIAIACHFCGWLTSLPPSLVLLLMCVQFSMGDKGLNEKKRAKKTQQIHEWRAE